MRIVSITLAATAWLLATPAAAQTVSADAVASAATKCRVIHVEANEVWTQQHGFGRHVQSAFMACGQVLYSQTNFGLSKEDWNSIHAGDEHECTDVGAAKLQPMCIPVSSLAGPGP